MKSLFRFSRSFPYIIRHDTILSNSSFHTRSNSNTTSHSSSSARSTQTFGATRIDGAKLRHILNKKFDKNYRLTLQLDTYTLVTDEEPLTEEDIRSCAIRSHP
ncbi:hypothetical protein F4825DRAFT_436678 [Nemania diffusa]|nr:hypothetical protein F4825DRAFT_436678 [Nemania diffusa]